MGMPAANAQSTLMATDTHIVMIPSPGGPIPTPLPSPFVGMLNLQTAPTVNVGGQPSAVVGTQAQNNPPHIPAGGPFQKPPANLGEVTMGSSTVFFGGKAAARATDMAKTCNDPAEMPIGQIIAGGTVFVG
jgi:uncharacterized Zn-binding protein involved in type VI secretion